MINDINKRVLIWRFTLVLIKINYGQIGDQTGLFYTTNPVFYTSGNRFVRRTGTFGNLWFFSLPGLLGQVSYCHHFSSIVRRPSVNISHFNLLLRNHWTNCNQTLVEWSLDGPLSKLCPVIPTSIQDGRQAKNRKKGDGILIVHCCFSVSQNELKF